MGYYTGSGEVTGGGSTVSLMSYGPSVNGGYHIYQRTNSSTTRKGGLRYEEVKDVRSVMSMTFWRRDAYSLVVPACRGTRKDVSYSQIEGSNLYELVETNEQIQVRVVEGDYDSGWVS